MLPPALAFSISAASGILWWSREQNMSPSFHLFSENSWKVRLNIALLLGFVFLCLSVRVTGVSCLEQPPGTTQNHTGLCALKSFLRLHVKITSLKSPQANKIWERPKPINPQKTCWRMFPRSLQKSRTKLSLNYSSSFIEHYCTYEKRVWNDSFVEGWLSKKQHCDCNTSFTCQQEEECEGQWKIMVTVFVQCIATSENFEFW